MEDLTKARGECLKAILELSSKLGGVRQINIADTMGVKPPTVSKYLDYLTGAGYIERDPNGRILLTEKGRSEADHITEKQNVLTAALRKLGVDEATSADEAAKIAHDISEDTFSRIKALLERI